MFHAIQFTIQVYEAAYTKFDDERGRAPIPFSGDLEIRVVTSGLLGEFSTSRD